MKCKDVCIDILRNVRFIMISMKPCYPMKPKSNQREEIKIPKQLEIS